MREEESEIEEEEEGKETEREFWEYELKHWIIGDPKGELMKSKVYSFRLSEEAITQIEANEGRNLTEKLENLIFKCCLEIPAKEKELAKLNEQIGQAKYELEGKINRQKIAARQITNALGDIQENLKLFLINTSKPG